MPKQNGTPVNFGFTATASDKGLTSTGYVLTGFLIQDAGYETGADVEDVRALQGDKVARNHYDIHTKATLRFVVAATTKANAVAATTLTNAGPGDFIVITACASHPDLIGTNWEVQAGARINGDITRSAEITIPLEKRAGITAAQS